MTKNKITAAVVIALVLVLSFLYGGNVSKNEIEITEKVQKAPTEQTVTPKKDETAQDTDVQEQSDEVEITAMDKSDATKEKEQNDKYLTDPASEEKPAPTEPENAVIGDKQLTCTLSVRCDTILSNIGYLDEKKEGIVPADGVIFEQRTVTFYEGESVFNLLTREMKKNKIHLEFVNTPIYNSAYIEGIANLYEFDCGELSGWMYKVNGWFPNYGCSRYQLKEGDTVEWVYTCDLGKDVGGSYSARNGR